MIAAVAGYALGGGCELAMMCDFILAADNAKFGQPEIKLGVTPGMGGSQRLTRAVGKAKAMEMCLTGRMMGAEEAERSGLVARVVPAADLIDDAMKTAATIAGMAPLAVKANKEMVNAAFETGLDQGLIVERRIFQILAASEDTTDHKPNPAPLLHGAARLSVPVQQCVYVGDAVVDIQAAQAAGMASIAVTWGAGDRDALIAAAPDHLADTAEQLQHLLLGA